MKLYLRFSIVFLLSVLFWNQQSSARTYFLPSDSTCCMPDSLKVVSLNQPVFCVSWEMPGDSCERQQGFEIQWRLVGTLIWKTRSINPTGPVYTYCDTAECGKNIWRVRTKCDDSTFSDWAYGSFTLECNHDGPGERPAVSITPNPASEQVSIIAPQVLSNVVKMEITNSIGRNMLSKNLNVLKNQFREKVFISGWPIGVYYVSLLTKEGKLIRGSFIKVHP